MKSALKFAIVAVCLSFFFTSSFCLAQTESQATNPAPLSIPITGPTSDWDKAPAPAGSFAVPAEHWRERSSGFYLEYYDVNAGTILGWTIIPSSNRGYDKYGVVTSDFTAHWSTQTSSRWASSGEVGYLSPFPFSTYDFYNAWGAGGSGTMTTPVSYYQGSLFESFFDGAAVGPGGVTWTDDGNGTWSLLYVSDPGNYIDNRVYDLMGDGTLLWRGSTYGYGYSSSFGFSLSADCRRLDDNISYTYGLQFFSSAPAGQTANCYGFHIADDISGGDAYYSVWRYDGGTATSLIGWTQDPAVNHNGEWNNLRVETLSGNMEFFVNDVSVGTIFDTTYSSGAIGVHCYDPTGDSNVQFDNITVHRQPSVLVGSQGNPNPVKSVWGSDTHVGP